MIKKNFLKKKKILFLAPAFFGYELKIKFKMEQLGASVDYYDARSITSSYEKALLKISSSIFKNKTKKYYRKIINENKSKNYDYVFIVKCDMISADILNEMKSIFNSAKFCLYLWDSVKNIPGIVDKFQFFHKISSFDREDVKNYKNIQFRPLFYIDNFKRKDSISKNNIYKYDLSFCGTVHSDRYRIIQEIKNYSKKNSYHFFTFLYLQSKFIYWYYKLTKKEFISTTIKNFDFDKMNGKSISEIVNDSRVVLDIQHPKQTGLTMRTIEMLGMEKKLITTNQDIVNYDFYKKNNILVIPRKEIKIPKEFLSEEYEPLSDDIYQKYSIEYWILDILTE
ncbi:MAG: capsular biosynthesis protein CpsH [Carnobacterium sp.]|uniref:capsular biosynthesis protein CpsH n=1 Tax=Carnobacterium sp. TaxID=48221 RepID=UPI003C77A00C